MSDITNRESINVNILTHIIIERLKTLIKKGKNYETAKKQAQNELLTLFKIDTVFVGDFENMNISNQDSKNGILIALSSIFQGRNSVPELSKLLADFKEDFADDGLIKNTSIQLELIKNAKLIDVLKVRNNIEKYYNSLGLNLNVPDFEIHIKNFIDSVNFEHVLEISYPVTGDFGENLLAKESNTEIEKDVEYSITAIFPSALELLIRLKMNKKDGDVAWETDESKQKNWFGLPTGGEEIKGMAVGEKADMPIQFSGTGKIEIQVETFKIGAIDEYLETKQIILIVK